MTPDDEHAREPTDAQLAEAERLLEQPPEALYRELGDVGQQGGLPSDFVTWGKERFRAIRDANAAAICGNSVVRSIYEDDSADPARRRAKLVCSVAAVLVDAGIGAPVMCISALIVKEGIESLCAEHWRPG